jgi:hypothetical protein
MKTPPVKTLEPTKAIARARKSKYTPKTHSPIGLREEAFTTALAGGNSATESARLAGYTLNEKSLRNTASRLMADREIITQARKLLHESLQNRGATPDYLVDHLMRVIEGAQEGSQPQYMAAVKALELLGRLQGVLIDKGQIDININPDAGMSLADKQRLLRDRVAALHARMEECEALPAATSTPDPNVVDAEFKDDPQPEPA